MYNACYYAILIVSIFVLILDSMKAEPYKDSKQESLYCFRNILIGVATVAITYVVSQFALDHNLITKNDQVALIYEAVFLVLIRPVLAIIAQFLNDFLRYTDNAYAQRVDPVLMTGEGKNTKNRGILFIAHLVIFAACFLASSIAAAIPELSGSRINAFSNWFSNLWKMATGTSSERILFAIWCIMFLIFWASVRGYLSILYKNFMLIIDKKASEIDSDSAIHKRNFMLGFFLVRKIYNYLFIMDNYRLQDFLFWWIFSFFVGVAILLWWLKSQRNGKTFYKFF